ncbi:MAG: GGDEF domain-containing protein, partial [Thermoanaerobaculia bacterium]
LFEQTERLATTDGLTGLTNHRTFQARLDEHLAQTERYGKKLSLILCDIDHFKSVNDTYGHPVGDEALRLVAEALARNVRGHERVFRVGGEEFAVLLPGFRRKAALQVAEQLRAGIEALAIPHPATPVGRVTASFGVATLIPGHGRGPAELIENADLALYRAKSEGKNRVCAGEEVAA